jgi:hypothetical protein
MTDKQTLKIGEGKPGPGRKKGGTNKSTALLKDAILQAGELAGGKDGLIGYLRAQALANPGPFMSLLGKVLPVQVNANVSHSAERLSDDELASIIAASRYGIAEAEGHTGKPH